MGLLSYNKDYVRKGLLLNMHNFTFDKVNLLSENLNLTYSLGTWVKRNKKRPIIAISGEVYDKVKSILYPHIVPGMKYKLPCSRVSEQKQIQEVFARAQQS